MRHGLERYAFRLVEGSRSDVTAHAASILRTSRWSLGSECSNGIDMGRATCWYYGREHADGRDE